MKKLITVMVLLLTVGVAVPTYAGTCHYGGGAVSNIVIDTSKIVHVR